VVSIISIIDIVHGYLKRRLIIVKKEISKKEAFLFWLKLGFIGFGGPAGQISMMHSEVVERRKWVSENRFLYALNYCMMLPGPEAQQLATYLGWLMHGNLGGIVAGVLFVIPALLIMILLSWMYVSFGHLEAVSALLYGIKPAIVAIVANAVLKIGNKALKNRFSLLLAAAAFVSLYFFSIPFPLVILFAGLAGLAASYYRPDIYIPAPPNTEEKIHETVISDDYHEASHMGLSVRKASLHLLAGFALWAIPFLVMAAWLPSGNTLTSIGLFFTKVALVTFGGAYAVLPYVAQNAIDVYGWITPDQMIEGLALGEVTPGPLIKIVAFLGYVGAFQTSGLGIAGGIAGAAVATYYTFLPSFLFILVGAPVIEASRRFSRLTASLSAITAAVVGVIFNLAIFFGSHVFLRDGASLDLYAIAIAILSFAALWRFNLNILYVILGGGVAGLFLKLIP
jgi:chromate transporter